MIIKTENVDGRDCNVGIQQLGEKVNMGLILQEEFSVNLTRPEAKRVAYALLLAADCPPNQRTRG